MTQASSSNSLEPTNQMKNNLKFELSLVQQPFAGKSISHGHRARGMKWPLEPPPVLELTSTEKEPSKSLYIHNPNWFCVADLICVGSPKKASPRKDTNEGGKDNLSGLLASSLHKVKNPEDRNEHGYFVFGDLNVRDAGTYKLEFTLFEMRRYETQVYAAKIHSIVSNEFTVSSKANPQVKDSTKLSKVLSESGVKIRLRKESTKRKAATFNWSSTTTANCTYSTPNPPQTLAPMANYPHLAQTSSTQNNPRNSGEDVSQRIHISTPGINTGQIYPASLPNVRQHHGQFPFTFDPAGQFPPGHISYMFPPPMYAPTRAPSIPYVQYSPMQPTMQFGQAMSQSPQQPEQYSHSHQQE